FLHVGEGLHALLQELLRVVHAARPRRRPVGQPEPLAVRDDVGTCQCPDGTHHASLAKYARTWSAVFAPTTEISSSRVARRTPARLPNATRSAFRRRGPMPAMRSRSERRSRFARDWR